MRNTSYLFSSAGRVVDSVVVSVTPSLTVVVVVVVVVVVAESASFCDMEGGVDVCD